jgi:hypothetical protein
MLRDNTDTSRFNVITHPRQKIYCFAHIPPASSWLRCQAQQQLVRQLLLIQKATLPRLCEATSKSAYPRSATQLLPESKPSELSVLETEFRWTPRSFAARTQIDTTAD